MKKHLILTSLAAVLAITGANAVELNEVVTNAKLEAVTMPENEPQVTSYGYDSTGDGVKDAYLTSVSGDSIDPANFTYTNRKGDWADLTLETATGTETANNAIDAEDYFYYSDTADKTYYGTDADIDAEKYTFNVYDAAGEHPTNLADTTEISMDDYTYAVNQEFTKMTTPQTVAHEPVFSDYSFVDAGLETKTLADYMKADGTGIDSTKTAGLDASAQESIGNAFVAYTEDHAAYDVARGYYDDSKTAFDEISAKAGADRTVVQKMNGVYLADKEDYDAKSAAYNTATQSLADAQGAYGVDKDNYDQKVAAANAYDASLSKVINDKVSVGDAATLTDAQSYADGKVNAEKTAREAKDTALNTAIETEAGIRAAADEALNTAIATEASTRANADAALQTNIDNEVARATAAEEAIRGEFAAADARTLASANAYTDKKVDTLEKNVSGGIAAATALSAVNVSNVGKGEVSVGGGYGYYNSQSAVALGAAMGLSDRWSVNAGAGIATGDKTQVSFRAGTNYKFKLF